LVLRQTSGMVTKCFDYSAISNTTTAALCNHPLEFGPKRLQSVDAALHLLKLMLRSAVGSLTRPFRIVCQG
jgi:hypothetical protein